MDLDKIKMLIDAMSASGLAEMEFSENGWALRLARQTRPAVAAGPPGPASHNAAPRPARNTSRRDKAADKADIRAPLSGIVYLRPGPGASDFVESGQMVAAGTPICVIEAMKLFHEVRSERDGTVEAILIASGQEVEAGQPLMRIR
jgi:acetyl-CoA carboxylase biotin carboxyl carrier protein